MRLQALVVLSVLLPVTGCASLSRSTDADAVRAVLEMQTEAWNRGDLDGFLEGYHESEHTVFATAEGTRLGFDAMAERYRSRYPEGAMGQLTTGDLDFRRLAVDTMAVSGTWSLKRKSGPSSGSYVLVLRRVPEGWRIVLDYTTLVEG